MTFSWRTTIAVTFLVSATIFYLTLSMGVALSALAIMVSLVRCHQASHQDRPLAPGPKPWPVLGSLHLMNGFRIPYAAFTSLAKAYGNVFSMKLGSSWCVVVNDPKSVKEVLITKGAHFDGRPTLKRLDILFGGDKENSLAFCNNSEPQKKRRQILQKFTFPHSHSDLGTYLDQLCVDECQYLVASIRKALANQNSAQLDLKPLVGKACANIFNRYFCSSKRCDYEDNDFNGYYENFDKVFWEVNNGRAVDFLPWLMPFYQFSSPILGMKEASQNVRDYVTDKIIAPKRHRRDSMGGKSDDFLDTIMDYIDGKGNDEQEDAILTSQSALYALEDILGGHSAVANIILRILYDLSRDENKTAKVEVKEQISQVAEGQTDSMISLEDRPNLPWVVASMHETIRMTCSPIVPHLTTQDSSIEGYHVPKDTVVFVNNHKLNMSDELWNEPEVFDPKRFLDSDSGEFTKPSHFQPFSMGKRSCMGYKMVHNVAFSIVANLMMHFDLHTPQTPAEDIPLGMLALPPQPFRFSLSDPHSRNDKTNQKLSPQRNVA